MNRNCNCGHGVDPMDAQLAASLAQTGFVITDMVLYLDTHPDDRDALEYFAKKKEQYERARHAYSEQLGPVTTLDVNPADGWTWGDTPWPWEV